MASRKSAKRSRRFSGRHNLESLESRILLSATSTVQLSLVEKPLDDVSGSPQNLSPAMIEQAYDFDNLAFSVNGQTVSATGAGETIAIVDAFGDPDISSDLETFDANFGITNDNANGQFVLTVATPGGGAVQTNAGWATEESLDVEWAHAIAPEANILLVEANSDTVPALGSGGVGGRPGGRGCGFDELGRFTGVFWRDGVRFGFHNAHRARGRHFRRGFGG